MFRNAPASLDAKRLFSLCMIMEKFVPTLELHDKAVMVNVVGGVQVRRGRGRAGLVAGQGA